jgi:hypothetical protein
VFFALSVQLAQGAGRRLYVPELGVIRQGTPQDSGALRAAWIRKAIAYLRSVDCAGVAWWHALGSNARDFRLDTAYGAAAWQDAIAGRI